MTTSKPEVFIIESLTRKDEKQDRYEGRRIADMLRLSRKECRYVYVRTLKELRAVMKEFRASNFRYLHLSCHGNKDELGTTYDNLPFSVFGEIVNGYIAKKRVFVSACEATNRKLARILLTDTGCRSLMGPSCGIYFGDAAMFWASFYHLMFKEEKTGMTATRIRSKVDPLARIFETRIDLFTMNEGEVERERFGAGT
jgi:hypothetical protein